MIRKEGTVGGTKIKEAIQEMALVLSACYEAASGGAPFDAMLKVVGKFVDYDAATIHILDHQQKKLEARASVGGVVQSLSFLQFYRGDGLTGWTGEQKRPLLLRDRSSRSNFDPDNDYATFLSLPLLAGEDDVIGVLNVGCKKPAALCDDDCELLMAIGRMIALGHEIARLKNVNHTLASRLTSLEKDPEIEDSHGTDPETIDGIERQINYTCNEINNFLAVIIGNIECLIAEGSIPTQKSFSRLRRTLDAAARLRQVSQNIVNIRRLINRQTSVPSQDKLSNQSIRENQYVRSDTGKFGDR